MEECQERDSSSDEERQIIEDDDMEDSPKDTAPTDIDFVKEAEETEEKGRARQFLLR